MELVRGYGRNFLHIAAGSGDLGLCKILVNQYDYDIQMYDNHGLLPLHHLAINGSYELFNFFAEIWLDTHLRTKNGQNRLHIVARYGHLNLCKALIEKHYFDAQLVAKLGWTALHFSAEGGHYEVFKFLLIRELVVTLWVMMEWTVFILQHFMEIWIFARCLLICMTLTSR